MSELWTWERCERDYTDRVKPIEDRIQDLKEQLREDLAAAKEPLLEAIENETGLSLDEGLALGEEAREAKRRLGEKQDAYDALVQGDNALLSKLAALEAVEASLEATRGQLEEAERRLFAIWSELSGADAETPTPDPERASQLFAEAQALAGEVERLKEEIGSLEDRAAELLREIEAGLDGGDVDTLRTLRSEIAALEDELAKLEEFFADWREAAGPYLEQLSDATLPFNSRSEEIARLGEELLEIYAERATKGCADVSEPDTPEEEEGNPDDTGTGDDTSEPDTGLPDTDDTGGVSGD
ncbi:MAG: hypothetical protein U9Q81_00055 [Pseudomonadota bacterium]|nr:hypothetical protein [Pseudomonadota bacterium]